MYVWYVKRALLKNCERWALPTTHERRDLFALHPQKPSSPHPTIALKSIAHPDRARAIAVSSPGNRVWGMSIRNAIASAISLSDSRAIAYFGLTSERRSPAPALEIVSLQGHRKANSQLPSYSYAIASSTEQPLLRSHRHQGHSQAIAQSYTEHSLNGCLRWGLCGCSGG